MTVSKITSSATFFGNGAATAFSLPFYVSTTDTLRLYKVDEDGVLAQVLSGFSFVGNKTAETTELTFTSAPLSGTEFYVARETASSQLVSLKGQVSYNPTVVEGVWDKLTRLLQEVQAGTGKLLRATTVIPPVKLIPGRVLAANDAGTAVICGPSILEISEAVTNAEAAAAQTGLDRVQTGADRAAVEQAAASVIASVPRGAVAVADGTYSSFVVSGAYDSPRQIIFELGGEIIQHDRYTTTVAGDRLSTTVTWLGDTGSTPTNLPVGMAYSWRGQVNNSTDVQRSGWTTRAAFAAAVAGGFSATDGTTISAGGVLFEANAASNVISGLPGWRPFGEIAPQHFGAIGDGTTDDTAALNAMFAHIRAFASVGFYRPIAINGYGRAYYCAGSVNATGIYGETKGVIIEGITILSGAAGKVSLDCVGSDQIVWRSCHVLSQGGTDAASWPTVGWQFACTSTASTSCYGHTLYGCSADGKFRNAAFLDYGAELHKQYACSWLNRANPETVGAGYPCYAHVIQATNEITVASDFQTVVTGHQSNTTKAFYGCRHQKPYGVPGTALFLLGLSNCHFAQSYITSGNGSTIKWRLTDLGRDFNVSFDGLQIETTGNDVAIEFVGDGSTYEHQVSDLRIRCGNMFIADSLFKITDALKVFGPMWDIVLTRRNNTTDAPASGWFAAGSMAKFYLTAARLMLPDVTVGTYAAGFGAFDGTVTSSKHNTTHTVAGA